MIDIKYLQKSFSESNSIIENVSLSIEEGQWYTIVGPSGTGKSTLLKCISGLLKPDKGEVLYERTNIYHMNENARSEYRKKYWFYISGLQTFAPLLCY
ncbi:ATP-binding cassette domain-containing protein [Niallia circulans]